MKQTKDFKSKLRNVNVAELERTFDKCLVYFYAYPTRKIGLNNLSKVISSSKSATKHIVESLISFEFLKRDIIGKAWLLYANQLHPYFVTKKIAFNLSTVYESGIIEAVHKIIPSSRAIMLFGSYRWGTDIDDSDIDIAVEVIGNHELQIIKLGVIEKLGYRKNVPVNLHVFSRNHIDSNLFANIANGIILEGFLEVNV